MVFYETIIIIIIIILATSLFLYRGTTQWTLDVNTIVHIAIILPW